MTSWKTSRKAGLHGSAKGLTVSKRGMEMTFMMSILKSLWRVVPTILQKTLEVVEVLKKK